MKRTLNHTQSSSVLHQWRLMFLLFPLLLLTATYPHVVNAATAYTVGGTVSGLSGTGLVLANNGKNPLTVNSNGNFTFSSSLSTGSAYKVVVVTQPSGSFCTVTNSSGTVGTANITSVSVTCVPTFTVGGTVSGLIGFQMVLQNNGGNNLFITANGTFKFSTGLTTGTSYSVSIATQPSASFCTVTNGSGTVGTANITSVLVTCVPNTHTIGGTVTGLTGTGLVLRDNGANPLTISVNGAFTFSTPLLNGSSYSVTVATQPSASFCTVTNGSGTVGTANITSVSVTCVPNTHTIGGTVTGLTGAGLVLRDNGTDPLTISANGAFTFGTLLTDGSSYNVSVGTQPSASFCTVTNGSGTVGTANITSVSVTCVPTYTVGGTVSGLIGTGLQLLNNGGNNLAITANGAFTFSTPLLNGSSYSVTVATQPSASFCTVTNGSGTVGTANITSVSVTCVPNTHTIGGTVTGLTGAGLVLRDNGTDPLTISANGAFTFGTLLTDGSSYNVSVGTQPSASFCTVTNGSGTVGAGNITSVSVTCVPTYTVGGTVSGLIGTGLQLLNNGGNNLAITANGAFTFSTPLLNGSSYSVTVATQPSASFCTVTNGSGTVGTANITSVSVTCVPNTHTIGGTVTGLTGAGLVLRDNGTDPLTISANGAFTFGTLLTDGSSYNVSVGTQPSGQTCAVSNGSGTVSGANVTNVTVTCTNTGATTYTVGGTLSGLTGTGLVLRNNGTDVLNVSANGSFTFVTSLTAGSAYSVSVGTQPTSQFCSVANGSGTVSANVNNVLVTCGAAPISRYVYVANYGDNTVSIFAIDATSGQLRSIGYVLAGTNPKSITVDPSARFLYVANAGSNNVSAYTINATTGALTTVVGSVAAGTTPQSVTVDPLGRFVYVVNSGSNNVSAYTINATTGALTSLGTVAAGTAPQSITIDPSGRFAYVTNGGDNTVSQYTIVAGGALSSLTPATVAAGVNPQPVSVDPSGKFAFVANAGSNNVSAYTINATTGVLTSVGSVAAGTAPQSVTVDPSGKFAFAANGVSGDISSYSINATTGVLTSVGLPVVAGMNPSYVIVDSSGQFAYAANAVSNTISAYTINAATGVLTPLATSPTVGTRQTPVSIAMARGTAPVTFIPKFAYVANWISNDISADAINTGTGVLTRILCLSGGCDTYSNFRAESKSWSITADPMGRYVYVVNYGDNSISAFNINSNGSLSSIGLPVATGVFPESITADLSGRFVYVANTGSNDISAYKINAGGSLTSVGAPVAAGTSPMSISVDPLGRFVYVVNYGDSNISAYTINTTLGTLAQIDCGGGASCDTANDFPANFSAGTYPQSISIDPSGRYAYVANTGSNNIFAYTINADGTLANIGSPVVAGANPISITISPSGKFAYVANYGDNTVSTYSLNPDGTLTAVGSLVPTGTNPMSITVDFSGKFAYVANVFSADVSAYTINTATGALTPINCGGGTGCHGANFVAGYNPNSIITTGSWQ